MSLLFYGLMAEMKMHCLIDSVQNDARALYQ